MLSPWLLTPLLLVSGRFELRLDNPTAKPVPIATITASRMTRTMTSLFQPPLLATCSFSLIFSKNIDCTDRGEPSLKCSYIGGEVSAE